jgi:hypothetical protein
MESGEILLDTIVAIVAMVDSWSVYTSIQIPLSSYRSMAFADEILVSVCLLANLLHIKQFIHCAVSTQTSFVAFSP